MLYLIKFVFCILFLGRKPLPPCQHEYGKFSIFEDLRYRTDTGFYGKIVLKRVCSKCLHAHVVTEFTSTFDSRADAQGADARMLKALHLQYPIHVNSN